MPRLQRCEQRREERWIAMTLDRLERGDRDVVAECTGFQLREHGLFTRFVVKVRERPRRHRENVWILLDCQDLVDHPSGRRVIPLGNRLHDRLANPGIVLLPPRAGKQLKRLVGVVFGQRCDRSQPHAVERIAGERGVEERGRFLRLPVCQRHDSEESADHVVTAGQLSLQQAIRFLESHLRQECVGGVKADHVGLRRQAEVEVFCLLRDGDAMVHHLFTDHKAEDDRKLKDPATVVCFLRLRDRDFGEPRFGLPGIVDLQFRRSRTVDPLIEKAVK